MHLWLSPKNAKSIVPAIVASLGKLSPGLANTFGQNGRNVIARLSKLERALSQKLTVLQDSRFAVFHDAFQYYERAFGLSAPLVINLNPEHRPSAARVRMISGELRSAKIKCVFAEPQFSARHLNAYISGTGRTLATLDPLGSSFTPGKDLYFQMMHGLADGLLDCLQRK